MIQTSGTAYACEKCNLLQPDKTCPRCGAVCVEFVWGVDMASGRDESVYTKVPPAQ